MTSAPRLAPAARAPFGTSFGAAALLHAAFVGVLIFIANRKPPDMPPVYRVNILAAPPGPRAIGVVSPTPPPEAPPPEPTTPPPLTQPPPVVPTFTPPKKAPPPVKPQRATPTTAPPPTKRPPPLPPAGGGPTGGTGTDVATVQLDQGIDFPYPAYLNNIVRQVALNFKPDDPNTALRAVVMFVIRRNGTISKPQFSTRSGDYAFDLEAQGAIEKAATAFGPLPDGFKDDALPVYFSFDPRILH